LLDAASKPTLHEVAIVLGVLLVICGCGMLWGQSSRETSEGRGTQAMRAPFYFWRSGAAVTTGALGLLAVPSIATRTIPGFQKVIARLHGDILNAHDLDQQRRGYYEELDVSRMDNWQWQVAEDPEGWREGGKVFFRDRPDFVLREIVPSVSTVIAGAPITSNHLGMRDREYEKTKPANTYRIVLLGASNDMGFGVKDDQTYENLLEDRLNQQHPDPRYLRYEILNLSVAAHSILQRLLRLEEEGFALQPDAAIFSVAAADAQFLPANLRKALIAGIQPPPEYRDIVEDVVRKAHVNGKMPGVMIERRLRPYVPELCEWSFRRFAQDCRQHGVRPLVVYRPAPADFTGTEPALRSELVRLAQAAGLEVIDLSAAFDSVTDRNTLILGKWDDHTTPLGHRLLAEKLYEDLAPLLHSISSTVSPADK
jgi:lysophospholipase L1-like esterase